MHRGSCPSSTSYAIVDKSPKIDLLADSGAIASFPIVVTGLSGLWEMCCKRV
jgi:hypothetical protein